MSDGVHWVVPYAACAAPACREAAPRLALPRLQELLGRLGPGELDTQPATTLSMPHERVLADACGLSAEDGRIPWAAWEVERSGGSAGNDAWAWMTPCHWRVGSDHVAMQQFGELELSQDESRELLEAMRPFFEEDGIAVSQHSAGTWLARGELFRGYPAASLDRVWGGVVDEWLPRVEAARPLRRLQQEMQMLLYTHAATDRAVAERRLPVNSFWVSGAGALDARERGDSHVQSHDDLREPALRNDGAAWSAAWQALDTRFEALLAHLDAGHAVTLTLCGDRSARTYESQGAKSWRRITRLFSRSSSAAEILEPL